MNNKLNKLVSDLRDKHGEASVMFASEASLRPPVSSGSLALDFAIGHGGLPSDRVIEIAGAEGCGKTTLALLAMQNFLDNDPSRGALILDLEHKLTTDWVRQLIGSERMERVILAWPDHAEQATNIYKAALRSEQVSFAMFDSIGGAPSARWNDDAEVGRMGGNALAITEFARTAAIFSDKYHCLTVGINQTRADMDGYHRMNTPGGHAWKHACVLRIQLKRGRDTIEEPIGGEKVPIGYTVFGKVVKNQLAAPGRSAMWWFFNVPTEEYGFGVDTLDEIIRLGILTKVIAGSGWYHHPALPEDKKGEHKVNGIKGLRKAIDADPVLRSTLVAEILAHLDEHASEVAPLSDPEAPIEESGIGSLMLTGTE